MKSAGSNEEGKSGQGTRIFTATGFCSREKIRAVAHELIIRGYGCSTELNPFIYPYIVLYIGVLNGHLENHKPMEIYT